MAYKIKTSCICVCVCASACVHVHLMNHETFKHIMGWDRSVGIATCYGLDGPGIETRWGARFSTPIQTSPGAHPASRTVGTGSFQGVKRPGRGADHPPASKHWGHEKVELYLYSPSGPQWPVVGGENPFIHITDILLKEHPFLGEDFFIKTPHQRAHKIKIKTLKILRNVKK